MVDADLVGNFNPWELVDEDLEQMLDTLQERALEGALPGLCSVGYIRNSVPETEPQSLCEQRGHTGYPRPFPSGVEGMLSLLAVSSGGCFCPACEMPEYYQWLKFRCDSVTEVFGEIYQAIKNQKHEVEFRYNGSAHAQHMRMGVNFRTAHRLVSAS